MTIELPDKMYPTSLCKEKMLNDTTTAVHVERVTRLSLGISYELTFCKWPNGLPHPPIPHYMASSTDHGLLGRGFESHHHKQHDNEV